jgi:hypothetical protein
LVELTMIGEVVFKARLQTSEMIAYTKVLIDELELFMMDTHEVH